MGRCLTCKYHWYGGGCEPCKSCKMDWSGQYTNYSAASVPPDRPGVRESRVRSCLWDAIREKCGQCKHYFDSQCGECKVLQWRSALQEKEGTWEAEG